MNTEARLLVLISVFVRFCTCSSKLLSVCSVQFQCLYFNFLLVVACFVVSTAAFDSIAWNLERLDSEITYYGLSGSLNIAYASLGNISSSSASSSSSSSSSSFSFSYSSSSSSSSSSCFSFSSSSSSCSCSSSSSFFFFLEVC